MVPSVRSSTIGETPVDSFDLHLLQPTAVAMSTASNHCESVESSTDNRMMGDERIALNSVLDLAIGTWTEVVDQTCEHVNSWQTATEHNAIWGDTRSDVPSGSTSTLGPDIGPSAAARRLDALRERVLGRVIGIVQRLADD